MTKKQLYKIAEELGITDLLKAAEEFERIENANLCKAFAMKERRIEVCAALNRASDMIRLKTVNSDPVILPDTDTPVDCVKYI